MKILYFLIIILFILIILFTKNINTNNSSNLDNLKNCYKKKLIMSTNEINNYWRIKEITDKLNLLLFTKVRMIDIVEPKKYNQTLVNKIIKKHLDFVIINKNGYTVCSIEIDDNSHRKEKQQKSDSIKNFILNDTGIKLIRTKEINKYEIENQLMELSNTIS